MPVPDHGSRLRDLTRIVTERGKVRHVRPGAFVEHDGYSVQCPLCIDDVLKLQSELAALLRASASAPPAFTENEVKDVLCALYQDGDVDLVLADRIAALMQRPAPSPESACSCEVDRHDFDCPIHNATSKEPRT